MLRASAAGVTVLAVTDHDTVGGCEAASLPARRPASCSSRASKSPRSGTAATSTCSATSSTPRRRHCTRFSPTSGVQRIDRLRQMVERLAALGIALDAEAILRPALADPTKSAGRPWIARALVAGGHAANTDEAFDRWLTPWQAGLRPAGGRITAGCHRPDSRSRRGRVARASRSGRPRRLDRRSCRRRSGRDRGVPQRPRCRRHRTLSGDGGSSASPCRADRIITEIRRTARPVRARFRFRGGIRRGCNSAVRAALTRRAPRALGLTSTSS